MKPRTLAGNAVTTPRIATQLRILPTPLVYQGFALGVDEYAATKRLYQYVDESNPLLQAAMQRDLARSIDSDGRRVVAYLAKHVEPGKDPLAFIISLLADTGVDVPAEDLDYADLDP
jgi:hypothetical protein